MTGTLHIVSTPIGNLKDITLRALDILRSSEYVLAESSARTSKLLNEYNIDKKIITFNKDNEKRKIRSVTEDLNNGKNICLVSDAGTPSVSDPGFELIKNLDSSIDIIPIPGPSSLTATLSISQIPINKFMFLGFLPKKNKERKTQLNLIKNTLLPAVIFESKHRILSLLVDIVDVLGAEVQVAVMRELTKLHEEVIYDSASNLLDTFTMRPINGEITMVINAPETQNILMDIFYDQILELSKKYSASEIVNIIRLFHDVKKKELYKYVLKVRQGD